MGKSDIPSFDLKKYPIDGIEKLKIGIVHSEWNGQIVDQMFENCAKQLLSHGILKEHMKDLVVPGSFELPWGAKQIIAQGGYDGIICLGCVVKGETRHDDYINHAIAKGLMGLNLASNTPVLFGVLTTDTLDQAKDRSSGKKGNKGLECADSLLKMISASQQLKKDQSKIGFGSR